LLLVLVLLLSISIQRNIFIVAPGLSRILKSKVLNRIFIGWMPILLLDEERQATEELSR